MIPATRTVLCLFAFYMATMPGMASVAAESPDPHAYFNTLIARSDHWKSFSLRPKAGEPRESPYYEKQLLPQELGGYAQTKERPVTITYDPANDPDPRRQDAAKVVILAKMNNIPNQVRLPMQTENGNSYLVTWDAWFGAEFAYPLARIRGYKNFQFTTGSDDIWFETLTMFVQGRNNFAWTEVRAYVSQNRTWKDVFGPNVKDNAPLTPAGEFTMTPQRWIRYWWLIDVRDDWDVVSMWMADEDRDPVQLVDGLQIDATNGRVDKFWLEYNTSTSGAPPERGPLVGYVRNVSMLRNVADPKSLLIRPSAGEPLPPPPPGRPGAPRNLRIIPPPL
jgi:hypothetical protein